MSDINPEASFETLKTNVVESIKSYFPFDGKKQRLEIENVRVEDKLAHDDIKSQSEAKDKDGTWGVPIKGDVKLIDKATGQVIDTKKGQVLARLPKLTNRYGYIVNGSEYQVDHLFRLKSGAYARVQDNGDLETEFNLAKSPTGRGFSIKLERPTKKFSFKYGDSHIELYPVLKSLGISDDQLEHDWGKTIFDANKSGSEDKFGKTLHKFWKRTSDGEGEPPKDVGEYGKYVNSFFDQTVIRPDTTAITLGKAFTSVNGEALRLAAKKILGVSQQVAKPDDRDSLAFKEIASVEEFIPEKIARSSMDIKRRLRQTVDHKQSIGDIIAPALFNRPIHEFFSKGGSVTERSDQTNPIQMLSAHRKTTLMSKDLGGIKGDNNLTSEMRAVNSSHLGFLDPMGTPESERTGITVQLAAGARKNGKELETPAYDLKTGKLTYVNVPAFHSAIAVLPDQVKWVDGKPIPISKNVKVKLPGGSIEVRPFESANYVMASAKGMFSYSSNLIPFLASDQGNRVSMADKQMEQSIGLKHREAPLVQAKSDSKNPEHTFDKLVGSFTVAKATAAGTIHKIDKEGITISGEDGNKHHVQLYNHFPLNEPKGMLHSTPLVKVGDKVTVGQTLADSNYTKNGVLAIGTNLRVGYIPYKGYNFEDGIVISESAAEKLTSEHLHKKILELDPSKDVISKERFKAFAVVKSNQMSKEQWDNLDDNGVIKVGTKVLPGQVLIAAVGKNVQTKQSGILASLGKRAFQPMKDKSLVWDEDHVGVVIKVVRGVGDKTVKVHVKTEEPAVIGDKLTGRHGNKGIITMILPNHEMPFTKNAEGDRKHLDVLLNPHGVPSRMNIGQMLETAAAKIAEKTGKTYIVNNFSGVADARQKVLDDLAAHGLKDEEQVYEPKDVRRPIGSVLVGPQYLLKLKHQVEKKLTVRGGGTDINGRPLPYDVDKQPTKGGERGGQGFGQLDMYAMLGHDARNNIREMTTFKSDQQDELFWKMIQEGHEPPPPKPSFAFEKFVGLMKGLGLNVTKEGTGVRLLPMTHKEVLHLAGNGKNEITKGHLALLAKNLKEEPGGLFDPQATGGLGGDKWSFLRLAEPIPNPIFVGANTKPGPVPTLLGLKMKELDAIMAGEQTLEGKTGGAAIEAALKKVDVEGDISKLRKELPTLTGAALDRTNKKLKFLLALKAADMKPHEAYILHSLPIIPPKFRPATPTHQGDVNYAPINGLYKNVSLVNDQLKNFDSTTFSAEHKNPLRVQLWDAMKALQSVGKYKASYDSDSSGNRELKGILDTIGGGEGEQPKEGFFQSKLIKRRQTLSLRSTIVPEPALHIDEVGLPRDAAMELYKPFVVAQLYRWGVDPLTGQKEIKKGSALAFKGLEKAISERPLLLKRDPVLHKFGIMAFKPKLVSGKAIQIHPLVTGGFNADFDGDTMAGTVPLTAAAVEEAKKMFPSQNLFSPSSGRVMYTPNQDAMLGLHLLTKWGKESGKSFASVEELAKAVDDGKIHQTDIVKVTGFEKPTTYGRILMESRLPRGFSANKDILHNPAFEVNMKTLSNDISTPLAKSSPNLYVKAVDDLKDLGNEHVYKLGFSIGLKDLKPLAARDPILAEALIKANQIRKDHTNVEERDIALVKHYTEVTAKLDAAAKADLTKDGNRMAMMVYTNSKGKPEQLRQILSAPMLLQDPSQKTIPVPVQRSYSEGLDIGDYWTTQSGARMGTIGRTISSAEPGAVSKDILNATMGTVIVSHDCGTKQGILMDVTHRDVHDRYTSAPYKLKDGTVIESGTLLTPELTSRLKNNKIDKVLVRSPLKCEHGDGICSKCFGLNENGHKHDIGTNIGVLAGQALGEPITQMAMDSFHCNHADSVVFVRPVGGKVIAPSMEALFDMLDSPIIEIGGEDVKYLDGWEVYDGNWVGLNRISKHSPDRPLVMVSNQRAVTICQDNHPIAVWVNNVSCPSCGYHRLKSPSPASGGKVPFCPKCGTRAKLPALRIGAAKFLPPTDIEKGKVYLQSNLCPSFTESTVLPEFDSYLIGAFIAEGSVRVYAQKGSTLKKPYSINIAQLEGVVKERIVSRIPKSWSVSRNKKSVTIHSLELGTKFLEMFGRYSKNKALPFDFIHYPKEWVGGFLSGLIDGDGTVKRSKDGPDQIVIDSTSFEMIQQAMFMCARLGITTSTCLSKNRELTRNQGFKLALTMTKQAVSALSLSVKVQEIRKLSCSEFVPSELRLASNVRQVMYTHTDVYDIQTATGTLFVGGLKSHNSGGVSSSDRGAKAVGRITRLRHLLEMPKTLRDAATLATASGPITSIKKDAVGGVDIHIGNAKHYVAKALVEDNLHVGQEVKKGDKLSLGHINPHDLMSTTNDIHAVQNYLTNEMYSGIYEKEGTRRRNIEVAVRALTNLTKIKDPGHSDYMHGDIVPRSVVEAYNRELPKGDKPVLHDPILKGAEQIPAHATQNWMARLNYRYLHQTIQEAAGQHQLAELHGNHPIPGIAMGSEFGKPPPDIKGKKPSAY